MTPTETIVTENAPKTLAPTPGPWEYDGVRVFAPALDRKVKVYLAPTLTGEAKEVEHGLGLVALVYACGPLDADYGSLVANGRLLAAASDLLESARAVLAAIDSGAMDDFGALHRMRLSIQKAEGQ